MNPTTPQFASFVGSKSRLPIPSKGSLTTLRMASDDFSESKYTEAAWSSIAALTKVAEYYSSTYVEACHLLDVVLNPTKHNAGEDAEAAKKVTEKALSKAGADITGLRKSLDEYISKMPKVESPGQPIMGRSLQGVLESARNGKGVLGVSSFVNEV